MLQYVSSILCRLHGVYILHVYAPLFRHPVLLHDATTTQESLIGILAADDECLVVTLDSLSSTGPTSICAPRGHRWWLSSTTSEGERLSSTTSEGGGELQALTYFYGKCNTPGIYVESWVYPITCAEARELWHYGWTGCTGCGEFEELLFTSRDTCAEDYITPATCNQANVTGLRPASAPESDELDTLLGQGVALCTALFVNVPHLCTCVDSVSSCDE